MGQVRTTRDIHAPKDIVFRTVAHIEEFSKVVPNITDVEFISENKTGIGAKFKETRNMNGSEASVVLEVLEYEENEHIRLVSDAGGTIWDTTFSVNDKNGGSELIMVMDVKAYRFLAKIMNLMIMGMVSKAIEKDMDAVKHHCEQTVGS